jgi:hypothetical protein
MKQLLWRPFLVCLFTLTMFATATTQTPSQSINDLAWISGDWQSAPGGRAQVEEHWTKPAGATMMAVSRTIVGERTAEFEYLRIEQRAEGIFYVAHPKARCPGTDFKLTKLSGSEAVFENPEHDFPKRVIYRRVGEDGLTATIDGGEGTKAMAFPMKRVN